MNVEQVDDDTQDVTVSVGQVEEVLWVPTGTFDAYLNTWLPPLLDDEAAG